MKKKKGHLVFPPKKPKGKTKINSTDSLGFL